MRMILRCWETSKAEQVYLCFTEGVGPWDMKNYVSLRFVLFIPNSSLLLNLIVSLVMKMVGVKEH